MTLSFTLPTNLASGADLLPIGSWSGAWNTSATHGWSDRIHAEPRGDQHSVNAATALTVFVGATVSPPLAQAAGNYSGTVTMSAVYF